MSTKSENDDEEDIASEHELDVDVSSTNENDELSESCSESDMEKLDDEEMHSESDSDDGMQIEPDIINAKNIENEYLSSLDLGGRNESSDDEFNLDIIKKEALSNAISSTVDEVLYTTALTSNINAQDDIEKPLMESINKPFSESTISFIRQDKSLISTGLESSSNETTDTSNDSINGNFGTINAILNSESNSNECNTNNDGNVEPVRTLDENKNLGLDSENETNGVTTANIDVLSPAVEDCDTSVAASTNIESENIDAELNNVIDEPTNPVINSHETIDNLCQTNKVSILHTETIFDTDNEFSEINIPSEPMLVTDTQISDIENPTKLNKDLEDLENKYSELEIQNEPILDSEIQNLNVETSDNCPTESKASTVLTPPASPLILSYTPSISPCSFDTLPYSPIEARKFKRESSVDLSDGFTDDEYFEDIYDENMHEFMHPDISSQEEEVYSEQLDAIPEHFEDDMLLCDENENKTSPSIPIENVSEKILLENVEEPIDDIIMSDHNYVNHEKNSIINSESYLKHTTDLKDKFKILIRYMKDYQKIPELVDNKSEIEETITELEENIIALKTSMSLISEVKQSEDLPNDNYVETNSADIPVIENNIEETENKLIKNEIVENDTIEHDKENNQIESVKVEIEIDSSIENSDLKIMCKVEEESENVESEMNENKNEEFCESSKKNIEIIPDVEESTEANKCVDDDDSEENEIFDDSHLIEEVCIHTSEEPMETDEIDNDKNVSEDSKQNEDDIDTIKLVEAQEQNEVIKDTLKDENVINNLENISEKVEDENCEEIKVLNKFETLSNFAKSLFDSCQKLDEIDNIDHFYNKINLEFNRIMILSNLVEASAQTDYSGKIYSDRRLKNINEKEKHRLLNEFTDSSELSSEYESDNESNSVRNSNNEEPDEQDNIFNGIDFSKYLESSNDDSDHFPNNFSDHLDVILEEDGDPVKIYDDESNLPNLGDNKIVTSKPSVAEPKPKEKVKQPDSVDKEIDRLLNFNNLSNKKEKEYLIYQNVYSEKRTTKKVKTPELSDILQQTENDSSSDQTESEEEDCIATESTFLNRQNEDIKKQLLESSSNSEESVIASDEELLPDDVDDDDDLYETKPSLVDKFLESYIEIDETEKDEDKKLNGDHFNEDDCIKVNDFENDKEKIEKNLENKENDLPDDESEKENANSDCEILDKSFASLKRIKRKSLETLLVEDQRRRKNQQITDELISLSSDEDSDIEFKTNKTEPQGRIIRPIMRSDQLTSETKKAQKEEASRLSRLKKKENILKKAYKDHSRDPSDIRDLILDYNNKTKQFITVHSDLVKHLKQHQIDGVKFMYDSCYGSVNFIAEFPGSGCILAHCMGLGKTLQLIALLHTVICHKDMKTSRILILCPKSTVMNWSEEILRWLGPLGIKSLKIFTFNDTSDIMEKMDVLQSWHSCGSSGSYSSGCLLIGYEAFRTLVSYGTYKKRNNKLDLEEIKLIVKRTLLDPGADLVVCDEGHIIKNRKAAISQAVTEIRTPRRIVLTGTPIQNNLKEYYSMVNFIKPSFLGTEKEFANLYANPIKHGQHKDSSKRDIKIMKQRSFVLHSKLSSFVQRREAALLKTFLPQKFEYVLFIPMTTVQVRLYEFFLEAVSKREDSRGRNLLTDYTCLRKIWTHPKVLENAYNNAIQAKNRKEKKANNNLTIQSDDEEPDDVYDSQTGLMSVTSDWWKQHLNEQDLKSIIPSNKLQTMFEILRMCEEQREKCLIFSAFVAVLNVVEFFMNLIDKNNIEAAKEFGIEKFKGPWVNGKDYYRLDGKTPKTLRHEMVKSFNDPCNIRARVFLISAKAGGQGINLIGANRVIILDTSWNPSNDQQNIFRIFRLGQKRNCYIYRLISYGTMEERVYSRSVTKQAMSFRVMDEHQIDRHYSLAELAELYTLAKPDYSNRPIPNLPQDNILANLLRHYPHYVYKYHEHDSLLENKLEQELSEQEKEDAWLAYETEITVANGGFPNIPGFDMFNNPLANMPPMDGFPRAPNATDMYNQNRPPSQYFPNYNFANKSYLDNMLSLYQNSFSNPNSLYGLDLTKNPGYSDSLNSNYLLQSNNRNTTPNLSMNNQPVTSNYPSLDNLHVPSSHGNTYNPNIPYSSLYSNSNSMLNNSLNRFNNSSLESFKRVFENYVNPNSNNLMNLDDIQSTRLPKPPSSSSSHLYPTNSKQSTSSDGNNKNISELVSNSAISKTDLNSIRKQSSNSNANNYNMNLSSNPASISNTILNAQNRLINQTSDLNTNSKKNISGGNQKDHRNNLQNNNSSTSYQRGSPANINSFPGVTSILNKQPLDSNVPKTNMPNVSEAKKTDNNSLRNSSFVDLLRSDSSLKPNHSQLSTSNDKNERLGNKKPSPILKPSLLKQSHSMPSSAVSKMSTLSSGNKIPTPPSGVKMPTSTSTSSPNVNKILQATNITKNQRTHSPHHNSTVTKPNTKTTSVTSKSQNVSNLKQSSDNMSTSGRPVNNVANLKQSSDNMSTSGRPVNNVANLKQNSDNISTSGRPVNNVANLKQNSDNMSTSGRPVNFNQSLNTKNNLPTVKTPMQLNQELVKKLSNQTANAQSSVSKVNKMILDPSPTQNIPFQNRLMNAGISISKKPTGTKIAVNPQNNVNQLRQNQVIQNQRKRPAPPNLPTNTSSEKPTVLPNKIDQNKRQKLANKDSMSEELSSSLKRIQSSKGLTIVQKNASKGASSAEVYEVD